MFNLLAFLLHFTGFIFVRETYERNDRRNIVAETTKETNVPDD